MSEMNLDFPPVIELQIDNTTAIAFCNDSVVKSKLKHIDCRQEWVRMLRDKKILIPKWVHTDENDADFFTKILPRTRFCYLRDRMMVSNPMT